MYKNNLKVELDPRVDGNDEIYHIGRLQVPISIDLSKGIAFLIFLSVDGEEELQIANNDKENTTFSRVSIKENKLKIKLNKRIDSHDKPYYICKVKYPAQISCIDEACFMVFHSREGMEELQITGEIVSRDNRPFRRNVQRKSVEVVHR